MVKSVQHRREARRDRVNTSGSFRTASGNTAGTAPPGGYTPRGAARAGRAARVPRLLDVCAALGVRGLGRRTVPGGAGRRRRAALHGRRRDGAQCDVSR
jgi:hypothetical protein